jgi:hypothetical protein
MEGDRISSLDTARRTTRTTDLRPTLTLGLVPERA